MRPVTDSQRLADLVAQAGTAPDLYPALDAAMAEAVGHRLFTLMAIDHEAGEAARLYTNRPDDYPVGGRKPLGRMTGWGEVVLGQHRPWIGHTAEDIQWAFFDHELIASLGCASCLNLPVIDGGRVIGTVNLLHEAGFYDEASIAAAAPFAPLPVAPYRAFATR
jgi:hypothetical protein